MKILQKRAFTLVELLVVVSLVALLLILGLSVFPKVQEAGRETVNLSNLKQITVAYLTYASDHNGRIPATTQNLGGGKEGLFSTWGYNIWSTGGPRRLFQKGKWVFGTGAQDYLSSPDVFYGPFSILANSNRKSGEMWEYVATADRIGYISYFIPDSDDSSPPRKATTDPVTGRLLSNHHLVTGHPRSPLFSDACDAEKAEALGFPLGRRRMLFVAHLDGTVDTVSKDGALKARNIILYLAGLER